MCYCILSLRVYVCERAKVREYVRGSVSRPTILRRDALSIDRRQQPELWAATSPPPSPHITATAAAAADIYEWLQTDKDRVYEQYTDRPALLLITDKTPPADNSTATTTLHLNTLRNMHTHDMYTL